MNEHEEFLVQRISHIEQAAHTIAIFMGDATELYGEEDINRMRGVEGGLAIARKLIVEESREGVGAT